MISSSHPPRPTTYSSPTTSSSQPDTAVPVIVGATLTILCALILAVVSVSIALACLSRKKGLNHGQEQPMYDYVGPPDLPPLRVLSDCKIVPQSQDSVHNQPLNEECQFPVQLPLKKMKPIVGYHPSHQAK